jgi:hypothetical protein
MGKREETDNLAMEVYSLTLQNMSKVQIAKYLGIDRKQVYRLIKRYKAILRWLADHIDGALHLGETLVGLKQLYRDALENIGKSDPGSAVAVGWARVALDALKEMKKLLQECGAVFKMPESVEDGIPFDDPEIRRDYMELQARAWAKGKVLAGGKEGSGDE